MQRERPGRASRDGGRDRDEPRAMRPVAPARPASREVLDRQAKGRDAFVAAHRVSRETMAGLDAYVALLNAWQARINLVAPASLGDVWSRHLGDTVHLAGLLPPFTQAVDLGSGAGLPGAVVALCRRGAAVDMIESNAKKASFLRTVQRELGLGGKVHATRIEAAGDVVSAAEIVTARALAPLSALLSLAGPHLKPGAQCFFQKGRHHEQEIEEASALWRFSVVKHESPLEAGSVVLQIADVTAL